MAAKRKGATKTAGKRAAATKRQTKKKAGATKKSTTKAKAKPKVKKAAGPRVRRVVTLESLTTDFETLLTDLTEEIARLKAEKVKGTKFLKSVGKKVKRLQKDSTKLASGKRKIQRKPGTISGFKKPVPISDELCKFLKVKSGTERCRNDVTTAICAYIREHELQNPENRREIVPDKALTKLLSYNKKTHGPLTYARVQQLLVPHYPKAADAAPAKKSGGKRKKSSKEVEPEPEPVEEEEEASSDSSDESD